MAHVEVSEDDEDEFKSAVSHSPPRDKSLSAETGKMVATPSPVGNDGEDTVTEHDSSDGEFEVHRAAATPKQSHTSKKSSANQSILNKKGEPATSPSG